MFLLASYQFKNRKWLQLKHRKLAPPFFQPLTVKSYLKFFFSLLGPLYGYIASERAKCEKGQNCPSPLCMLQMLYFKRKLLGFTAKWHVAYYLGQKVVDWNIKKKLFLISLLAHLILMNMLRLKNRIFQN